MAARYSDTLDRAHAWGHAAARIGIGAAIALGPRRGLGRRWFGRFADDEATRIAMRGMGTREFVLGVALARELARGRSAATLFALCTLAEAIDVVGSLTGPASFRRTPAVQVTLLATTAAASAAYLARRQPSA